MRGALAAANEAPPPPAEAQTPITQTAPAATFGSLAVLKQRMATVDLDAFDRDKAALANGSLTRDAMSPAQRDNYDKASDLVRDVNANRSQLDSLKAQQEATTQEIAKIKAENVADAEKASRSGIKSSAGLAAVHTVDTLEHGFGALGGPAAAKWEKTYSAVRDAEEAASEAGEKTRALMEKVENRFGRGVSTPSGEGETGSGEGRKELIRDGVETADSHAEMFDKTREAADLISASESSGHSLISSATQSATAATKFYDAFDAAKSSDYGKMRDNVVDGGTSLVKAISKDYGEVVEDAVKSGREAAEAVRAPRVPEATTHLLKAAAPLIKALGGGAINRARRSADHLVDDVREINNFADYGANTEATFRGTTTRQDTYQTSTQAAFDRLNRYLQPGALGPSASP